MRRLPHLPTASITCHRPSPRHKVNPTKASQVHNKWLWVPI
uniref:Uncharacterized protein n=1 Tax=Arundo donax TaxID=35708 RepID=A0A0A8YN96_ARUDO